MRTDKDLREALAEKDTARERAAVLLEVALDTRRLVYGWLFLNYGAAATAEMLKAIDRHFAEALEPTGEKR